MFTRIARSIAFGIVVAFTAASLSFVLIKVAPGDEFTAFASSPNASPEVLKYWRDMNSYNLPIAQQYARWINSVAHGNIGYSSSRSLDVSRIIFVGALNTLQLMLLAFASSISFGVALGAWQGAHEGSKRDSTLTLITLTLYSAPEFWLALGLMIVFALWLGVLPASGMTSDTYDNLSFAGRLQDRARHLVLPWLTLTLIGTSMFARFQRSAMRDTFRAPFIAAARSRGVKETAIVYRHALRASLLPVVAVAGLLFPTLLTGAVLIEKVFAWPGLGKTVYEAANARDIPLVCGVVIVGALMTTIGALLADVIREAVDPRTRT